MQEFSAKIIDPIGFHARPAAKIVSIAEKFKNTKISLFAGEKTGNLKSIMNIMAMGIVTNTEIRVVAEGEQEEEAIKTIQQEMKNNKLI